MKPQFFNTRAHLLVCTSQQCALKSSRILFQTLWQSLERERLAYYAGGGLRLTESGCLGACQFGPNATCYRKLENGNLEEAWYYGLDFPKVVNLARALNAGEDLPLEHRYNT
jgi:(2Fe-2S) ferredoxin